MMLSCGAGLRLLLTTSILVPAAWADSHAPHSGAETVIVTARRNPDEPRIVAETRERLARTPGAVAVVAAEAYETRLAIGLPDLLQSVPGVLSNKRYGEESRLSIRGSGLDQSFHQRGVLLAQDGVPFADADGFSDSQKIDPESARYIEVYKGGNALRFGGAQLGGAVNLVTPTGRTAENENRVRVEGGSSGTVRGVGSVGRVFGDWDVYAVASGLTADGYRDNSAQDQARLTLNLGHAFGEEQEIRLIAYGADINQQVPGTLSLSQALTNPEQASVAARTNHWARDQTIGRLSLQTRWRFDEGLVFEGGVYATSTDLYHPISIVIQQQSRTQGAFGRFDWTGELGGHKADLFVGTSYRQGINNSDLFNNVGGSKGFQFGDARQKATGLDVFAEGRWFATDNLALVLGASWGQATRDYTNWLNRSFDDSRDYDWFAPRIGLLWESDEGIQVYANLTKSVEPPHYGALVQSPFPGLVPVDSQEAWTAEIGTRGRSGAFIWDVAFYRAELEGELLSFTRDAGLPANLFNAQNTVHQGIEASLDWRIIDGGAGDEQLVLRQTYAWSDFFFEDDRVYGDNSLPVAPEHQYRVALKYTDPSGFFVEPSIDWRPQPTFVDYANTLTTPGYTLLNVNLGFVFEDGVTAFVDARNLADTRYVAEFGAVTDARIATTNVFYPGEGRSVFGGLVLNF